MTREKAPGFRTLKTSALGAEEAKPRNHSLSAIGTPTPRAQPPSHVLERGFSRFEDAAADAANAWPHEDDSPLADDSPAVGHRTPRGVVSRPSPATHAILRDLKAAGQAVYKAGEGFYAF